MDLVSLGVASKARKSVLDAQLEIADLQAQADLNAPLSPAGSVAIVFDDGFKDNFTIAHPLLKERGIPATLFAATMWVLNSDGTAGWCSPADMLIMQDEGWEIGSHSVNHLNSSTLTDEQMHFEASESKRLLENAGFDIKTFALPFGGLPNNLDILPQYYDHICQTGSAINTLPPNHPYLYRYFPNTQAGTTVDEVMAFIADAEKRGGTAIIGFHRFGTDISGNAWSVENFTEFLDRLDATKAFTFRDIAKAKAPSSLMKLNKSHYQWGWTDSLANPLWFPVNKGFGWDYNSRSLGIDLRKPKKLKQVRIKTVDSVEPMINENNLEIWYSDDNVTFSKYTGGFTFYHYVDSKLEDFNRTILIGLDIPIQSRYWKFHQTLNHTVNKTKVDPTNVFMDAWTEQNSINF